MKKQLNPARYIRVEIFEMYQKEFAVATGTSQSTVCRWERDGFIPVEKHESVRQLAKVMGKKWNNILFVETPDGVVAGPSMPPKESPAGALGKVKKRKSGRKPDDFVLGPSRLLLGESTVASQMVEAD